MFCTNILFFTYRPPDLDKTELIFCPAEQFGGEAFLQYGSCCYDAEEEVIEAKFLLESVGLTAACADLYHQVGLASQQHQCLLFFVSTCLRSLVSPQLVCMQSYPSWFGLLGVDFQHRHTSCPSPVRQRLETAENVFQRYIISGNNFKLLVLCPERGLRCMSRRDQKGRKDSKEAICARNLGQKHYTFWCFFLLTELLT